MDFSNTFSKALQTFITAYGMKESDTNGRAIDADGNPLPMYTYPCIEYLKTIDWTDADVFEYGGGNSTAFWLDQGCNVTVVEHDKEWTEKIDERANIIHEEDMEKFVNTPLRLETKFDVIIIDGGTGLGARYDCIEPSLQMIKREGMIIFDSSEWHINTTRELNKQHQFIPVHFNGFMPLLDTTTTTTCYISRDFYRETKKLNPIGSTIVDFEPSLVDKSMKE